MTDASDDWEWEYYDDDDDDNENEEQELEATKSEPQRVDFNCEVGSARQWREMSVKIRKGTMLVDDEEDVQKEQQPVSEAQSPKAVPKLKKVASLEPTQETHLSLIVGK